MSERTASVGLNVGERLLRELVANSAGVGLGVQMSPKVPASSAEVKQRVEVKSKQGVCDVERIHSERCNKENKMSMQ